MIHDINVCSDCGINYVCVDHCEKVDVRETPTPLSYKWNTTNPGALWISLAIWLRSTCFLWSFSYIHRCTVVHTNIIVTTIAANISVMYPSSRNFISTELRYISSIAPIVVTYRTITTMFHFQTSYTIITKKNDVSDKATIIYPPNKPANHSSSIKLNHISKNQQVQP
ncbi:hypothetical protein ABFX02_08G197400 [Erythranthe guttata]